MVAVLVSEKSPHRKVTLERVRGTTTTGHVEHFSPLLMLKDKLLLSRVKQKRGY